jgi:SAM-dependent methyltransferase
VEAEDLVGALLASHVPAAKFVVDLGCGVGRYVPVVFDHLPQVKRFVGYDRADTLLTRARQTYGNRTGVRFENADIFNGAPYQKRSRPDVLLSIDTSRHYKNPLGLLDVIVETWPARYYLFSVLYGPKDEELLNGRAVTLAATETRLNGMGNVLAWQDIHTGGLSVRYAVIEGG